MHFYCFLIAFVISLSPLCSPASSFLSRHARHSDPFLYHTACQEHSYLTCTPSPFFLLFTRPCTLHCRSPFLLAFLLLAGDIELNPGPTNFTVCTLNIRSLFHPLHSAAVSDFIDSHNPDIFCLTEIWIKPTTSFFCTALCIAPRDKKWLAISTKNGFLLSGIYFCSRVQNIGRRRQLLSRQTVRGSTPLIYLIMPA